MALDSGIKQRRDQADYLNVTPGTEQATWALMGYGFTELNEEMGAQKSTKRYINDATASTNITGYESQFPYNMDLIMSEEAIKFISDVGKFRRTGKDAETEYIAVDLDEPVEGKDNTFGARKFKVSVEVSGNENNDGEMANTGNLGAKGDPVPGTFDTTTLTFTEAAKNNVVVE